MKSAQSPSKFDKKRAAITDVAVRHLNTHGVQGLNLSEVATELGMTKANLTYYFRRKDDLAAHCYNLALDTYRDMIRDAAQESTPSRRIFKLFENYFTCAADAATGDTAPLAILADVRALDEPLATQTIAHYSDVLLATAALLEPEPTRKPDLFRTAPRAELVLLQLFWSAAWLENYPVESYDRVVHRLHDIIVHGLARTDAQWSAVHVDNARDIARSAGSELERAEFFQTVTRMINERGYRGASLERIAEAMDATKGSIYYQFESKDELVVACFERSFALMWAMIAVVEARYPRAWDRLFTLVVAMISFQASERGPFLRESALVSLPPVLRQSVLQQWNRLQVHFASLVADAITEGDIRAVDPLLAAHAILAGINAADEVYRFSPNPAKFDAARHCARPLLFGILYDDPTANSDRQ